MILGLDLSSADTGYCVISEKGKLIDRGSIKPNAKLTISKKLLYIYDGIKKILSQYNIAEVAIEDTFLGRNVKTLKLLNKVAGVAILCAEQNNSQIFIYEPTVIKRQFTGKGNANKDEVHIKVLETLNIDESNNNITDAIAICYTHYNKRGKGS